MHGDGPFGLPWFWRAVLGIVAVTAAALVTILLLNQQNLNRINSAVAAAYRPPAVPSGGPTANPTAVFIGDSYTAGAFASNPAKRFSTLVAQREGWQEVNLGQGGTGYFASIRANAKVACAQSFCPPYGQEIAAAAKAKPSIVVVSGGRNDTGYPSSQVAPAVKKFYSDLHKALPDARIIVTSPIWDDGTPPAELEQIATAVSAAAKANGATYLDIGEPLRGKSNLIASAGVHPNDAGYAAIATAIENGLG